MKINHRYFVALGLFLGFLGSPVVASQFCRVGQRLGQQVVRAPRVPTAATQRLYSTTRVIPRVTQRRSFSDEPSSFAAYIRHQQGQVDEGKRKLEQIREETNQLSLKEARLKNKIGAIQQAYWFQAGDVLEEEDPKIANLVKDFAQARSELQDRRKREKISQDRLQKLTADLQDSQRIEKMVDSQKINKK